LYDDEAKIAVGINPDITNHIAMQIGTKTYIRDGKLHEFDTAPHIKNGRTFVPIRIIYEMLGYDVGYDEASDTAIVTSKQ